jgi:hypothetical protein
MVATPAPISHRPWTGVVPVRQGMGVPYHPMFNPLVFAAGC